MDSNPVKILFVLFMPLLLLSCAVQPFPGAWKLESLENKSMPGFEAGRILNFRPGGELKITLPDGEVREASWRWKDKGSSVILSKGSRKQDAEVYLIQPSAAGELRLLDEKGVISRFSRVPAR